MFGVFQITEARGEWKTESKAIIPSEPMSAKKNDSDCSDHFIVELSSAHLGDILSDDLLTYPRLEVCQLKRECSFNSIYI